MIGRGFERLLIDATRAHLLIKVLAIVHNSACMYVAHTKAGSCFSKEVKLPSYRSAGDTALHKLLENLVERWTGQLISHYLLPFWVTRE